MKQIPMFGSSLPPQIAASFQTMCLECLPDDIDQLQDEVHAHVRKMELALSVNEFLDIATAKRIADVLAIVMKDYDQHTPQHRAWIAGAARYFIQDRDVEPDTLSVVGLDDDVAVLNYVLDQIGRTDLVIEL
jgi:uncharacterized membrane protein YkvA (DUF1232 family)